MKWKLLNLQSVDGDKALKTLHKRCYHFMFCMNHKAYLLPEIEGTHTHTRTYTAESTVSFSFSLQYYYLPRFSRVPLRPFSFSAPHRKIYVKRKLTGRNIPIHLVPPISFSKQKWHINEFVCVTRFGQFTIFINTAGNYCNERNKMIHVK